MLIRQSTAPASIPAKPFRPPRGFKAMPNTKSYSDISEVFSDLCEKQMWHITTPASVPITSIRELALDALALGNPVMTHEGADYRLREDTLAGDKHILLPDKGGYSHHRDAVSVTRTFHVEQIVHLPNGLRDYTVQDISKPQRSQPKDLRMRYMPFGTKAGSAEKIGPGPADSETAQVTFQIPGESPTYREAQKSNRVKPHRVPLMQPGSDIEPTAVERLTPKKSKKTHPPSPEQAPKDQFRHIEPDMSPQSPVRAREKEGVERGRVKERESYKIPNESKRHRYETSQERRARKEHKKRKKVAA